MLVNVVLHGELGKLYGKNWELAVRSPSHALRLINANTSGKALRWIRSNASKYTHYGVICEYLDGTKKQLSEDDYELERPSLKSIHFTPIIKGASGKAAAIFQSIVGVVLIVVGAYTQQPGLILSGASMLVGGISQLLAPKVKKSDSSRRTSHYFNGTEQTEVQGGPIQLIYGRCLVQGAPISVATTVDQLLYQQNDDEA